MPSSGPGPSNRQARPEANRFAGQNGWALALGQDKARTRPELGQGQVQARLGQSQVNRLDQDWVWSRAEDEPGTCWGLARLVQGWDQVGARLGLGQ